MTDQEHEKKKLIFVYNANARGSLAGFQDSLHETFMKSTYQCNHCQVTFDAFGMKMDRKNLINDLDNLVDFVKNDKFKFEFLNRDEFKDKYFVENAKFPSAYFEKDNGLEVFITKEEMRNVKNIEELKDLVNKKIKKFSL